jgi:uracil-DNA glycosylase
MNLRIPQAWQSFLDSMTSSKSFALLLDFLEEEERAGKRIYPVAPLRFNALDRVAPENVRVVILGQDPYHGEGQATGLSFAVPNELKVKPPSLRNILKELENDLGVRPDPSQSDLCGWAAQGVLLLNTVLTVRANEPLSHRGKGWEEFTDSILRVLNEREDPVVFVLWGSHAAKKKALLDRRHHTILESAHPSPLSAYRGFFGSRVFSKTNEALGRSGKPQIDWLRISRS